MLSIRGDSPGKYLGAVVPGLALAELYSLFVFAPLLHSRHMAVYHWNDRPLDLFLPVFLDVFAVWVLVSLLLLVAYAPGRVRVAVWMGTLLFTPAVVSHNLDLMWEASWRPLTSCLFIGALMSYLLLACFWRPTFADWLDRIIQIASVGLTFVGIGGAVLLCQLAWFGWQARSLNFRMPLHHSMMQANAGVGRGRIIWIVFDELSYQQVYERRYPGLKLPAFDALAATSTVFAHVVPAGMYTDMVMPSLLSGRAIDIVRSSPGGRLFVRHPGLGDWEPFDQHETVFQDALAAGYSTAVVGWYIPYCRIMPAVLDACFWNYKVSVRNGMFSRGTLTTNMLQPLAYATRNTALQGLMSRVLPAGELTVADSELHIEDYRSLTDAADRILLERSPGFVLLHLPIPHPGGIFDRRTGQLTSGPSTYLDNLVLADNYLAHLRLILEQSGQWNSSTVVVMGDHSWRTHLMWEGSPIWTTEEQKASHGGKFDERPAYTVKLAGQVTGSRVETRFSALNTRALFDAILSGKIKSSQELQTWSEQL